MAADQVLERLYGQIRKEDALKGRVRVRRDLSAHYAFREVATRTGLPLSHAAMFSTAPDCFHHSTHQQRRQYTKATQRKMLPAARLAQPPTAQLVALNASESPASGPWVSERRPINENPSARITRLIPAEIL